MKRREDSSDRGVEQSAEAPRGPAAGSGSPPPAEVDSGVGYRVSLPEFEGPLDLLLHLIQQHELDILDIPIGFIAEKYVEYIKLMEELNIDLASEYLVMAATLAHIKSKMLLPTPPADQDDALEEEGDPRAELIRRLLEYQKYRNAAEQLAERKILGRDVFGRPVAGASGEGPAPLAPGEVFKLFSAFQRVLERAKTTLDHEVEFERFSISDRINQLVDLLRGKRMTPFDALFEGQCSKPDLIVTFLAILEMAKLRLLRVFQAQPLDPILVELADDDTRDAAEQSLESSDPLSMENLAPGHAPSEAEETEVAQEGQGAAEAEGDGAEPDAAFGHAPSEAEETEVAQEGQGAAEAEGDGAEPDAAFGHTDSEVEDTGAVQLGEAAEEAEEDGAASARPVLAVDDAEGEEECASAQAFAGDVGECLSASQVEESAGPDEGEPSFRVVPPPHADASDLVGGSPEERCVGCEDARPSGVNPTLADESPIESGESPSPNATDLGATDAIAPEDGYAESASDPPKGASLPTNDSVDMTGDANASTDSTGTPVGMDPPEGVACEEPTLVPDDHENDGHRGAPIESTETSTESEG